MSSIGAERQLLSPLRRLTAVEPVSPTGDAMKIAQPLTPLRDTVLMTNAPGEPSVGKEIAAEIRSADRVDLVVAFISWNGIRLFLDDLRAHVADGKPLRVITTTFTGITDLRALKALADIGAQIKVSYDEKSTRLHAKAWLFARNSGFSTVYIGSSNLTHTAQVPGLEWNIRASQRLNPELVSAFERTFSSYWESPSFEDFDPDSFAKAATVATQPGEMLTLFDIEPYPFQRQMLDSLQIARQQGRAHNLIVAATGTGKTIVAGLDYRRLRSDLPRARLLFVAHRDEILQQSLNVFRHILRDGGFGEFWVGSNRPRDWQHVFASIQSLTANDVASIAPDAFDVVIVDEFHHAAAKSYALLLDHLRPRHLLGLTATPERMDGLDVLHRFGGEATVDLRLWDALDQGLLVPFHYFGIHDATDLSGITWRRGSGYATDELTNLYTANDLWVAKVITAVKEKVGRPTEMRALGFCASIQHAEFMARQFEKAGIHARAVTSTTPAQERRSALTDLRDGHVQVLFTVDLFNEGIDLPMIDVVLMLRPTESGTVFLQQLGRGLRRTEGKDVLTVLDFVGRHRREFRFDLRYRRLLGRTRRQLEDDIRDNFPYLPAGCHMELDRVAQEIVLKSIRQSLPVVWNRRVQELQSMGDVPLATYLEETGLDIQDIYRNNHTWTELRRAAGLSVPPAVDGEARVRSGIARLLHVDDTERIAAYQRLLSGERPPQAEDLDALTLRRYQGLLLALLSPGKGTYASLNGAGTALWQHKPLLSELREVLDLLLKSQVVHLHSQLGLPHDVPLQVHASYTQDEILAAFGRSQVDDPLRLQAGVYWHQPTKTDLLFVTLRKSEKHYSPTTRYLDYAVSDRLFHWETQSTTTVESLTGQRYLHHQERGSNVVLFIRMTRTDDVGRTMPYFCAGLARYVRHQSERPIQITWRLDHPLPGDVFSTFRAAVA